MAACPSPKRLVGVRLSPLMPDIKSCEMQADCDVGNSAELLHLSVKQVLVGSTPTRHPISSEA